ncbi:MAG: glycosyl transferase family 1 [Thermoplasmata archaeon]|nr:MAG: glycosyl transferase family 1 [Thermoplasmata archaeon]
MKRFKIALLHYSCPPVVGGVEEVLSQQAKVFSKRGNKVKVLAGAGERFLNNVDVETTPLLGSRNDEIVRLHEKAVEREDTEPLLDMIDRIYEYLKNAIRGFDVLIVHNVLTMHYNLPLTYALHRIADDGFPVINWCHDSPFFYDSYPDYLKSSPFQILRRYNENMEYVVISRYRKKLFYHLYGGKGRFRVIPNGIDPVGFLKLDPTTAKLIDELKLLKPDFIMVQPSRLHPRKNMELSIKVLKALKDRGLDAKLLITGAHDPHEMRDREYRENLLTLSRSLGVDGDVIFLAGYRFSDGEVLTPDKIAVRDLFLISDILFMPSYHEGFGIPLLESGLIKLPVVCSTIPPFREIGKNKVCFFSLGDSPDRIADKIISFTSRMKTHKLFRDVIKNYTWDNIYDNRILPLLETVIKK